MFYIYKNLRLPIFYFDQHFQLIFCVTQLLQCTCRYSMRGKKSLFGVISQGNAAHNISLLGYVNSYRQETLAEISLSKIVFDQFSQIYKNRIEKWLLGAWELGKLAEFGIKDFQL